MDIENQLITKSNDDDDDCKNCDCNKSEKTNGIFSMLFTLLVVTCFVFLITLMITINIKFNNNNNNNNNRLLLSAPPTEQKTAKQINDIIASDLTSAAAQGVVEYVYHGTSGDWWNVNNPKIDLKKGVLRLDNNIGPLKNGMKGFFAALQPIVPAENALKSNSKNEGYIIQIKILNADDCNPIILGKTKNGKTDEKIGDELQYGWVIFSKDIDNDDKHLYYNVDKPNSDINADCQLSINKVFKVKKSQLQKLYPAKVDSRKLWTNIFKPDDDHPDDWLNIPVIGESLGLQYEDD